jgi:DNA mismatch repair protein MutS2
VSARGHARAPGVAPPPEAELHLRGLTVARARPRLRAFLAECRRRHLRRVKVVHGKGTGSPEGISVVRAAVQRDLEEERASGRIRDFRLGNLGEGGAGVTIVWLR